MAGGIPFLYCWQDNSRSVSTKLDLKCVSKQNWSHTSPWSMEKCLPRNRSLVPKRLGTVAIKQRLVEIHAIHWTGLGPGKFRFKSVFSYGCSLDDCRPVFIFWSNLPNRAFVVKINWRRKKCHENQLQLLERKINLPSVGGHLFPTTWTQLSDFLGNNTKVVKSLWRDKNTEKCTYYALGRTCVHWSRLLNSTINPEGIIWSENAKDHSSG